MPFDVSGWVEFCWEAPDTPSPTHRWTPLLCLDVFCLRGDDVSDFLFGLSKTPVYQGLYTARGVPIDCNWAVYDAIERNQRFIEAHGEGEHGHTHAMWTEIESALARPQAPPVAESSWVEAFSVIRRFASEPGSWGGPISQIRFVVWAEW